MRTQQQRIKDYFNQMVTDRVAALNALAFPVKSQEAIEHLGKMLTASEQRLDSKELSAIVSHIHDEHLVREVLWSALQECVVRKSKGPRVEQRARALAALLDHSVALHASWPPLLGMVTIVSAYARGDQQTIADALAAILQRPFMDRQIPLMVLGMNLGSPEPFQEGLDGLATVAREGPDYAFDRDIAWVNRLMLAAKRETYQLILSNTQDTMLELHYQLNMRAPWLIRSHIMMLH